MILHVVLEEVFFKSPTREGTARKVPLRESLVLFAVNANVEQATRQNPRGGEDRYVNAYVY